MNRLPLHIFYIYFSPYTAHAIDLDGIRYPTVEHAYQCLRYSDPKIRAEISAAKSPVEAWEISTRHKDESDPSFRPNKREMMKKLMRMKMEQHAEVRKALLDSGDKEIVKHIDTYPPGDGFWDDGKNGEGENQMGKIWMELREELKKDSRPNM
ncbi:NADAR family protein [Patescibacteria group bacterium]|nr:NADAR family protein [Patescibacteria group bacterium]MDE1940908.1 NADAR family protein [Patescibacteria group bacterium]